jgi:hypothetical protein
MEYATKANTFFLNFLIPVNDKLEIFGDDDPYIISYDGSRFFLQAGVALLF